MKFFKILCAAALLCAALAACGEPQRSEIPEKTTVPVTTRSAESSEVSECVSVGREQAFTYTDKNGTEISCVYRIPALRFDSDDAKAINEEITAAYAELFGSAQQAVADNKAPDPLSVDYSAYVNDDIVSLVITSENQSHNLSYNVFNYNKTTDKSVDNAGLLNYLNRDFNKTYTDLKKALEADYTSKFKEESFPNDYYVQLEKTTSDYSVIKSKLFLNENAELYAVCTEYASVGDGEFQVLISLSR